MSRKRFDSMECSVAKTLDVVGDWWTLLIVRDAFFGLSRFAEFHSSLGIAKNILSDRLSKLVEHEIFEKRPDGRSHVYKLTKKGRELWTVMTALRLWGDKWVFDGNPPVVAQDAETGAVVSQMLVADENGEPIDPRKLVPRAPTGKRD